MAVDSKNPAYVDTLPDWITMRDTNEGERHIKEEGITYLPATSGHREDGMVAGQNGRMAYEAYKLRARFPDTVNVAIEALLGVMHSKPPTIELPSQMEPMMDRATLNGEGLEVLLRRINEQQLTTGRLGLLVDIQDGAAVGTLPYIAMYTAEAILNWDNGTREGLVLQNLNLVSLDESEFERTNDFEWEFKNKTRVAILGDPLENEATDSGSVYRVGVFRDTGSTFNENALITPSLGGRVLDEIPFVFINATDVVPAPCPPPLLGLANIALGIYRGEADYRQALFMQGQDTLVIAGVSDPDSNFRTGANAAIVLPMGGTAEYIGVDSQGLEEMRKSIENDKGEAAQRGGQMLDAVSRQKESGDALRIRVVARTATLNQLARTGAFGLQMSLRQIARWLGLNEEEVIVTPNLDFVDDTLEGKTLIEYLTAKTLGAPFSLTSIHALMQAKGLTELTLEEEIALIESEEPLGGPDVTEEEDNPGDGEEDG